MSSAVHAASHALVALVGSALALALGARWGHAIGDTSPLVSGCMQRVSSIRFCSLLAGRSANDNLADQQAFSLSVVGLAVLLVKGLSGVCATYIQTRIAGQVGGALRLQLFDALIDLHRLRLPRHADHGSGLAPTDRNGLEPNAPGNLVPPVPGAGPRARAGLEPNARADLVPTTRAVVGLTDRIREVEAGLGHGLLGGARSIAQLVPLAALLAALSLRAAAIAAAVLAGFGWLLRGWRSAYRDAMQRAARQHEQLVETADDSVRHADLWVSYGAEAKARANVRRLGDAVADGWAHLSARAAALSGANEVLGGAALAIAIGSARAGWLGSIGAGATLLAFAVTFFLAYRPLRELADSTVVFARAQVAYDELRRVIESAHGLRDSETSPPEAPGRHVWPLAPLELVNLRLAQGAGGAITLRVAPGAIAVVTGSTGAGKTTLLRTLLGLENALGGEVTYGGSSLRDEPAGPVTRPFAWVPQDAPLLADTLSANIALGASSVDVRAVLDPLGASHLVRQLDASRLGEGGRTVSGGERQWIALARAVATRQPVLLLDEPTSGLDPHAEGLVLEAVRRLRGARTVILVTHRSAPLAIADVVVRIDAGGATEVLPLDRAAGRTQCVSPDDQPIRSIRTAGPVSTVTEEA